MVHVVVVGGAGNVGREIVEELVSQGKHKVTIWSQRDISSIARPGLSVQQVDDYSDKSKLVPLLKGVDTVLSFINRDEGNVAQLALIDASVEAGVKRFAPSEWALQSNSGISFYAFKDQTHEYLQKINAEKQVIEYTLFQPGVFTNYLGYPKKTAKYLHLSPILLDLERGLGIMVDDGEYELTATTIEDTAKAVALAIGYEGKWPEYGGIVGQTIKAKDIFTIAERVSGKKIDVQILKKADLEKGQWNAEWLPEFSHPNFDESWKSLIPAILITWSLAFTRGVGVVEPQWNELVKHKYTNVEEFLHQTWGPQA